MKKPLKNREYVKRVVDGIKTKLKTESDPERKRLLAIWGEEFNKLFRELK